MGIAIHLSDQQAQAPSETARRLQVSEADLAAAAVRDLVSRHSATSRALRIESSRRTRSFTAGWPEQIATGR